MHARRALGGALLGLGRVGCAVGAPGARKPSSMAAPASAQAASSRQGAAKPPVTSASAPMSAGPANDPRLPTVLTSAKPARVAGRPRNKQVALHWSACHPLVCLQPRQRRAWYTQCSSGACASVWGARQSISCLHASPWETCGQASKQCRAEDTSTPTAYPRRRLCRSGTLPARTAAVRAPTRRPSAGRLRLLSHVTVGHSRDVRLIAHPISVSQPGCQLIHAAAAAPDVRSSAGHGTRALSSSGAVCEASWCHAYVRLGRRICKTYRTRLGT